MPEIKVGQIWTSNDGKPSPFIIRALDATFATVSRPDGTCRREIRLARLRKSGRNGYRMLEDAPCPENP